MRFRADKIDKVSNSGIVTELVYAQYIGTFSDNSHLNASPRKLLLVLFNYS